MIFLHFNFQAFYVLRKNGVNVQMISQGASKVLSFLETFAFYYPLSFPMPLTAIGLPSQVNISLVVNNSEAEQCVQALHQAFFETPELTGHENLDGSVDGYRDSRYS